MSQQLFCIEAGSTPGAAVVQVDNSSNLFTIKGGPTRMIVHLDNNGQNSIAQFADTFCDNLDHPCPLMTAGLYNKITRYGIRVEPYHESPLGPLSGNCGITVTYRDCQKTQVNV